MGFLQPKPAPIVDKGDLISPEKTSNWFSQMTFGWVFPLLKVGYSRPLEFKDLWRLEDERLSAHQSKLFEHNFYDRYAHIDAAYRRPRYENVREQDISSQGSSGTDAPLADLVSDDPNEERLHNMHPGTSRADLPGNEPNIKEASIRQAEKIFVPSMNRWGWIFHLLRRNPKANNLSFEQYEKAATRSRSLRLFWAAFHTVRKDLIMAFFARIVSRGSSLAGAVVVKELIRFVTQAHRWHEASDLERTTLPRPKSLGVGFGLAIGLAALQQSTFLCNGFYSFRSIMAGSLLRTAVVDQVARKSMCLSTRARVRQTTGRLTSAVSGDAHFMDTATYCVIDIVVEPIAIVAGCALLIYNLKYSALVGVGILFASSPILTVMMNKLIASRKAQMKLIDQRLRLLTEVFKAIRQIKLYAYEAFFGERIIQVREKELHHLKANVWNRSLVIATMTFVPILAAVLTFITYGLTKNSLEPAVIFSAFQLFNIIQTPMQNLPAAFAVLTDAWVALGRLSDILLDEEYTSDVIGCPTAKYAIQVNGSFTYETAERPSNNTKGKIDSKAENIGREERKQDAPAKETAKLTQEEGLPPLDKEKENSRPPFTLHGINLAIPQGAFVCVVGRVGTGKSALLEALIGEMRQTDGSIQLGGSLSYVAQQSWIQNATLQENITFSNERVDEEKLSRAVQSCALTTDLEQLQDGLDTEIGERGINLSGGQKARIALARAVYHNADIVLLDSPLAAVDSHVSAYLIERCILGTEGFGKKTRILVTHHLEVLPRADLILVMEGGHIVQKGTYADLVATPGLLQSLMEEFGSQYNNSRDTETKEAEDHGNKDLKASPQNRVTLGVPQGKLIMDEERNTGGVSWRIYMAYGRVMSKEWWFSISILALILEQASSVLNTLFLGFWSGQSISGFQQGQYMGLYASFGAASALGALIASYTMFIAGIRASFIMFDSGLKSVLRSPISFHDATPVGRIIHRLTKDVEKLDDRMCFQWYNMLVNLAAVFGTIFLVFYVFPLLGILFIPLTVIYIVVGKFISKTSREITRLDAVQKSFIYSAFGEQLDGLSTIRAFGFQQQFRRRLQTSADRQIRSEYINLVSRRWLVLRLDSLGTVLVLGIGLFGVAMRNEVDPVKLGVVLTYAIRTVLVFGLMVHYTIQVGQEMNTAERVLHYIDLNHEGPPQLAGDPPASWPQQGHVVFHNVQMRYRPDLPLVLKGLTFEAQPGEKIGIVGRTGAGKSSLAQTLFRLVELAGGDIEIDGYNLQNIGLDTLRSQLSALPQDTLLFSGTMRDNLDPTGIKTDYELNEILQRCGLEATGKDFERLRKFRLDSKVSDDGDNFSGGERQLVALCRALVKNSKVLLLDEATSSVDPETDTMIQDCIRKEFSDVTLLCIAHRLATIAFYDKVIVMDSGQIKEFDSPLSLFDNPKSTFRSMCEAASLSREAILRIRAGDYVHEVQEGVPANIETRVS